MKKENLPIIVGVALPIIILVGALLVVFVPRLFVSPEYDFVYTIYDSRSYNRDYDYFTLEVVDGKIKQIPNLPDGITGQQEIQTTFKTPDIFIYDVKNDASREISIDEAQDLALVKGPSSPDGYTVNFQRTHSGIFELFGSRSSSGYYIGKGNNKRVLPGLVTTGYYYNNFQLIGWVK
jgi:hypothetical protein